MLHVLTLRRLRGAGMMAAGAAIAAVFGGGTAVFLWRSFANALSGAHFGDVMTTVIVAPLVGGVPALLGVVLAQMGWRRFRGSATHDAP
ncbi:hypothetical protein [Phenylobacterium sp.]|uniref:hypothetical protein n=1 Tax=Phenylobacterium sp. TaxID=1871053 RepID=UPI0025E9799A|nr:hypothetical protein [Phenylobacterium sp.]